MEEKDIRFFSRRLVVILVLTSLVFLILEKVTHEVFLHHLAAIPLEIILGVFIVESLLKKKERQVRRKQLRYIKSHIFRSELRSLFVMNFQALKKPAISLFHLRQATLEQLREMRAEAERVEYQSLEEMEPLIMEYVKTQHVWQLFMEKAMDFHFENIVEDMIYIIHFIHDVRVFKDTHPDRLFVKEVQHQPAMMKKIHRVLGDGIRKFLDYAIELKEAAPDMLEEILNDYQYISRIHSGTFLTRPE